MKDLFPFTASNGVQVQFDHEGSMQWRSASYDPQWSYHFRSQRGSMMDIALREFFQAERDASLGRWRSKEHPDYVVYRDPDERNVFVFEEATGATWLRDPKPDALMPLDTPALVAREYAAAHPEPKPAWHNAKHNEIWVLFVAIEDEPYRLNGDSFEPVSNPSRIRIPKTDFRIQRGRRIFPEGGDES